MRFETVESFVQQLVLHKHYCEGELVECELTKAEKYDVHHGYSCDKCNMHCEIDPFLLHDSVWRYIRGGHKLQFQDFIKNLNYNAGGTYEDLFTIHLVMLC